MKNAITYLLIFLVGIGPLMAQQKKSTKPTVKTQKSDKGKPVNKIQILHADLAVYDTSYVEAHRLLGNVVLKHENVLMYCDSARYYEKENRIKAHGHIHVQQGDSLNLYGDSLNYDGKNKLAKLRGHIRMIEKDLVLTTDSVNFDAAQSVGYYKGGGTITSAKNKNTLTSKSGYYYSKTKDFFFKGNVRLKNPESDLTTDTLKYNVFKETAYFISPTTITTKDTGTIITKNGWYDTKKDYAALFERSTLLKKEKKITADTIYYDRKKGYGKLFGKAWLYDTTQSIGLYGNKGYVDEVKEKILMTKNPYMVKAFKKDTLFLHADTIFSMKDSNNFALVKAHHHVAFTKGNMFGKTDSLVYSENDSLLKFYRNPVLWYEDRQLTGDFMKARIIKNEIKSITIENNAFIISKADSVGYNQIKGRNVVAWFKDETISKIKVEGNGQTIYYAKEEGKPYKTVNKVDCSDIMIYLADGKIKNLTFAYQPDGTVYPIAKLPEEERLLKNFKWRSDEKPKESVFDEIKKFTEAIKE